MTFFPEPIKPSEGRQEENLIVNPIEGDKQGKDHDHTAQLPPNKKQSQAYGSIICWIKKILTLFSKNKGEGFESDDLTKDLMSLRNFLQQMKKTNQSENSSFCQDLSELWHSLMINIELASRGKMKTQINLPQIQTILEEIDHYPKNEEHKLGFYLTQYAGEKWLPIPFMEILKSLHFDYEANQSESILEKWIQLLNRSIDSSNH